MISFQTVEDELKEVAIRLVGYAEGPRSAWVTGHCPNTDLEVQMMDSIGK